MIIRLRHQSMIIDNQQTESPATDAFTARHIGASPNQSTEGIGGRRRETTYQGSQRLNRHLKLRGRGAFLVTFHSFLEEHQRAGMVRRLVQADSSLVAPIQLARAHGGGRCRPSGESPWSGRGGRARGIVQWRRAEEGKTPMTGPRGAGSRHRAGSPEVVQALGFPLRHRALAGDPLRNARGRYGGLHRGPMDRDTHRVVEEGGVGGGRPRGGQTLGCPGAAGQREEGGDAEHRRVYLGGISPPGPNTGLRKLEGRHKPLMPSLESR